MNEAALLPFARPSIDESTIEDVVAVLRSGWLTSGPKVSEFEAALSAYCGHRPVISCNSGTAALSIAMRMLNIGPGDEVITTPLSWVATANVIAEVGAKPVFVDVDPVTRNMDIAIVESRITAATRAILPVDLAGLPVNRQALGTLARRHGLHIVEDAAQSFGARDGETPIGSSDHFVAFSFHANKNITTGEGGALVLPHGTDRHLAEQWRLQGVIRGSDGSIDVQVPGMKANLTDIAAAIGLGQLRQLEQFTAHRRNLASCYFRNMPEDLGFGLPPHDLENSNWHMFQVLLPESVSRSAFIAEMKKQNILVGVHYPAIHLFSLYRSMGYKLGDFPIAEYIANRIVTLPLFFGMTEADVTRVCISCEKVVTALS